MSAAPALRSWVRRSVHIKLNPRPGNIHESSQVLRFLQQHFGIVTSFRNLRFDRNTMAPNVIMAVFETEEAAQKLISRSRHHVEIFPAASMPPLIRPNELAKAMQHAEPGRSSDNATTSSAGSNQQPYTTQLICKASEEDYSTWIRRQEFYGRYEILQTRKSIAYKDLEPRVPDLTLAYFSAHPEQVESHVVKNRVKNIAARKTLQQLWHDGVLTAAKAETATGDGPRAETNA